MTTDCALYLRVSTERQTVENQRPDLMKLARARGFRVVATYEEQESAVKKRPEYERMLEAAHRGDFEVLVVWSIDRFGRSALGNLQAVLELDAKKVRLVSVKEAWLDDNGGPVRELLIFILSWVAEHERARLIERTRAGMARARAEGKQIGRPRTRVNFAALQLAANALRKELGRDATRAEVASRMGISRASLNRAIRERRAERAGQKDRSEAQKGVPGNGVVTP